MKKIFSAVTALMGVCVMLSAQEVKIDRTFKNVSKANLPSKWVTNGSGVKDAAISLVKGEKGANILKVKSAGKYVAFYSTDRFPAVPGTTYKVTASIKGTAAKNFVIGYYAYSAENKFTANGGFGIVVNSPDKFSLYEGKFTLPNNPKIKYIRIQFGSSAPMDIEVQYLAVEALPAAK